MNLWKFKSSYISNTYMCMLNVYTHVYVCIIFKYVYSIYFWMHVLNITFSGRSHTHTYTRISMSVCVCGIHYAYLYSCELSNVRLSHYQVYFDSSHLSCADLDLIFLNPYSVKYITEVESLWWFVFFQVVLLMYR